MNSIKEFKIEPQFLKILTAGEKKIVPLLIEASKKIDKIFRLQENDEYRGANFYPHDATREEIEKAAAENPKIFSPFTIVKRENGKLTAVDYHKEYSEFLEPTVAILKNAAKITKNRSFKNYLLALAAALVSGKYQQADIAWLAVKNTNIDIIIGPHERYLDKLFFIKRAYQANVSLIDKEKTESARYIRDTLYKTTGDRPHRITPPSIVDVQIRRSFILAGFIGKALFSVQHLPSDSETIEKYGSKIIGCLSVIDQKFDKVIYPIFNALFEKKFKASYSKELLKKGNFYYALLTALAQQLHRYQNSRTRLRELFPVIDEANSAASGIFHSKHLLLKGVIDQKELESIMICQICWIFSEWIAYKKNNIREDYLRGDTLVLNFLLREGALQEKEGISWPNFAKIFFEMENLAVIFVRFLEEGTYLEVHEFLSHYLSFDALRDFDHRLTKIKPL